MLAGRIPCGDGGRDWVMLLQAKDGQPATRRQGQGRRTVSLVSQEGSCPGDTLVLDFRPPELRDDTFLLFRSPRLWYLAMASLANPHSYL